MGSDLISKDIRRSRMTCIRTMWTAAKKKEEVYNTARGDCMTKVRFWSYRKIKNKENNVKNCWWDGIVSH